MNQIKAIFLILLISLVSSSRVQMEENFLTRAYDKIKGGTIQTAAKFILAPVYAAVQFGGRVVICPLIQITLSILYGAKALLSRNGDQYKQTVARMRAVNAGVCGVIEKTVDIASDIAIAPISLLDSAKEVVREGLLLAVTVINPVELYLTIKGALKKEKIDLNEEAAEFVEDN